MSRNETIATAKPKRIRADQRLPTRIACYAPGAHELFIAGTFNDWDPKGTSMQKGLNGQWEAELNLPPGRYEYKFLADGEWCCEPGKSEEASGCMLEGCVRNGVGTLNRVLEVR